MRSREEFYRLPDAAQEEWIAEWEASRETCSVHGGPLSECGDDDRDWFPQRHICHPAMQLKGAERLYGLLHEEQPFHDGSFRSWAKSPSTSHPFHYLDGVSIWLSPTELDADDDFLSAAANQLAASGDEAEHEEESADSGDGVSRIATYQ